MEDLNGDSDKILVFRDGNMEMRTPKAKRVVSILSELSVEQCIWRSLDFKHFLTHTVYLACANAALINMFYYIIFSHFKHFTVLFLKTAKEGMLLIALTLRRLMSYIYGAPILDVSRSHTTTQHSR